MQFYTDTDKLIYVIFIINLLIVYNEYKQTTKKIIVYKLNKD